MGFLHLFCSHSFLYFCLDDDSVWGCGSNEWRQLGFAGNSKISKIAPILKAKSDESIEQIVAGHWNTAVILKTTSSESKV